jgi:quercetin dioxygenase-like cupin family protein
MNNIKSKFYIFFLIAALPLLSQANENTNMKITSPMVAKQIFDEVRNNHNWKSAFATGEQAQVVFMDVSPVTSPNNEIGMETHKFDQIIFVVEGDGNAILNGQTMPIKAGDMIFIPLGTAHNVINLNKSKSLKILSVYSGNDIAAGAVYKKNSDEPKD